MIRYVVFVIVTLLSIPSYACTCAEMAPISEDTVVEAFCSVDVVFVGVASDSRVSPTQEARSEIYVSRVFKGSPENPMMSDYVTTCDMAFPPGIEYLIFGNQDDGVGTLSLNLCGASRFTTRLELADFQVAVITKNIGQFESLCGKPESTERRLRILKGQRPDTGPPQSLLDDTAELQNESE
jgi:hypothetical protein